MIDVSVVVVTFKESPEVLRACFDTLRRSVGCMWELIIVDNGNRADLGDLTRGIVHVRIVSNGENRGFAYAVNQGMRAGEGRYFLLLNPDTEVGPDVLAGMVARMDHD